MSDEVNEKRREVAKAMGFPNAACLPPPQRAALDAFALACSRDGAARMKEAARDAAATACDDTSAAAHIICERLSLLDPDTVIKEPRHG